MVSRDVAQPNPAADSVPIYLTDVDCDASDDAIISCSRTGPPLGLTTCGHSQDVYIRCEGINGWVQLLL